MYHYNEFHGLVTCPPIGLMRFISVSEKIARGQTRVRFITDKSVETIPYRPRHHRSRCNQGNVI